MLTDDKTNADFIWYKIHTHIPKSLLPSTCYPFFTNINVFGQIRIEGRGKNKTRGTSSTQKSFPVTQTGVPVPKHWSDKWLQRNISENLTIGKRPQHSNSGFKSTCTVRTEVPHTHFNLKPKMKSFSLCTAVVWQSWTIRNTATNLEAPGKDTIPIYQHQEMMLQVPQVNSRA